MSCLEDKSLMIKLKLVFEEFDKGNIINDMLVLDQLLTWLQSELCDERQCNLFIEFTNFMSFASSCLDKSETEVQWSLLLQLVGRFASLETSVTEEFAILLFNKVCRDKTLWTQTSVRVAWLKGLASLSNDWKVLFYGDYFATVSSCLYDTSWFVRKAALSLLVGVIKQLQLLSSEARLVNADGNKKILEALREIIISVLTSFFDDEKYNIGELRLNVQLELIQHLDFSDVDFWCAVMAVTPQVLVSRLFDALQCSVEILPQGSEMVLLGVFQQCLVNEDCRQEILRRIPPFLWFLLGKNKVQVAISVAAWTFKWFGSGTSLNVLENIILLPISAAMSLEYEKSQIASLSSDHQEILSECFSHLISNTSVHRASLKLCISCMVQMGNHSKFIISIYEFLLSTYDESMRAHFLVSNTPVRLLCLDACDPQLWNHGEGFPNLHNVHEILLLALKHSAEDYKMLAKVLDASIATMNAMCRDTSKSAQLRDFMDALNRQLEKISCSSSWNVRDTVIEFFKRLLDIRRDADTEVVHQWIIVCKWHMFIWQALEDSDNFVRASSFLALVSLYESHAVWLDFTTLHVPSEVVKRRVVKALCEDPSEFVRRAAVMLVSKFRNDDSDVLHAMRSALTDADREVQLLAVQFWKNLLFESLEAKASLKYIDLIIDASSDYDRQVRIAALDAAIDIRRKSLANGAHAIDEKSDKPSKESLFFSADWEQQLVYEKQYIEDLSLDTTNALLDDVLTNLSSPTSADDDVITDCY